MVTTIGVAGMEGTIGDYRVVGYVHSTTYCASITLVFTVTKMQNDTDSSDTPPSQTEN